MRVHLFATLRDVLGAASVDVELDPGSTAQQLIEQLAVRYPALEPVLLDEDGNLHSHLKLFINGREVVYLKGGFQHVLQPADTVDIFPPVGGGQGQALVLPP